MHIGHIFRLYSNPRIGGLNAENAGRYNPGSRMIKPLRRRVLSGVMPRFSENLDLRRAVLGNDAGMIGALRFWLDRESETRQEGEKQL